jgi:acetylornithine deacetylase
MNVFELTRALVDIESITENEEPVGLFLFDHLSRLAAAHNGAVERMDLEPHRFNVFARFGDPIVTLSTHMDTVPPFIPSRDEDGFLWGRGACDTKGIIASMITAAEALLSSGARNLGLLFVVGEERNSAGAYHASQNPRGSRYIINGEPTENKLALGSKGSRRYEIVATGKMAHSAYPELGDSAIEHLLDALTQIRRFPLPVNDILGASTLNIGTISGGRAPNVIPDYAKAEVLIRLVDDAQDLKQRFASLAIPGVACNQVLNIPALHLGSLPGFETTVVAYTTDIPAFHGQWGQPFLLGPGTIHVAHTLEERVRKTDLLEAVDLYQKIVRQLQNL